VEAVLRDCSNDDDELISYLQRVSGYCLTGSISEQVFFFAYGTGGNGKGTWMNQLFWMLNNYSIHAQMSTFTEQRFEKHASEIAYFEGARVVTASETTAGARWHEQRIKSFTGGDPITANWMRENPFTFLPQFKLLFAGNTKPHLRNVDPAIKRRMFLIPFDIEVPEDKVDGKLPDKLQAEGGAILRWCIEGCLDWQENSLDPPDRVIATTQDYFESEDKIGSFLDDCIGKAPDRQVRTTYLFERYCTWAESHREYVPSHKVFLDMMETKGYRPVKAGSESLFKGLFIVYEKDAPDPEGEIPF
jgi:putative DNA primase/helicase